MFSETELVAYAHAEARRMGLRKSLDVKTDPKLYIAHCVSDKFLHRIRLGNPTKSGLRHELGHAYINEKLPKLCKFFNKVNKPLDFLCRKLSWFGPSVYTIGCVALPLLYGVILIPFGKPEISLSLVALAVIASVPFVDEFVAIYFGRKYRPEASDASDHQLL